MYLNAYSIDSEIFAGDHVRDPIDGEIRTVSHFGEIDGDQASVFLVDGGVIGIGELTWSSVFSQDQYPDPADVEDMIADGDAHAAELEARGF